MLVDFVVSMVTNQVLYQAQGRQRRNRGSSVIGNRCNCLINLVVEVGRYPTVLCLPQSLYFAYWFLHQEPHQEPHFNVTRWQVLDFPIRGLYLLFIQGVVVRRGCRKTNPIQVQHSCEASST